MGMADMTWGDPRFETVEHNGDPKNRLDIAILGDGYTAEEMTQYVADVDALVDEFRCTEPIATYFEHFNFHRVNVISAESGTDDAYADPPIVRNTALDTYFSPIARRRLISYSPGVMAVANQSGAPWDYLIVIVNYPRYGGGVDLGFQAAYCTNSRSDSGFPRIALHEAGHSIVGLFEEYDAADLPDIDLTRGWTLPNVLPWPNVDTNGADPKWRRWVTPGTELPTPDTAANDGVVGAFEGAANMNTGVYRPRRTCLMRDHPSPFCEVCREEWVFTVYGKSTIADSFSPEYHIALPPLTYFEGAITFAANLVRDGRDIRTTWQTRFAGTSTWIDQQLTNDYADLRMRLTAATEPITGAPAPASFAVRCLLEDRSPFLRTRTVRWEELAIQRFVWNVLVLPAESRHGDVTVPHADIGLIPHGDSAAIPHADVNLSPHGDSPLIPHGDTGLIPHGDGAAIPHGDANAIPHGDSAATPHADASTWVGHADIPPMGHIDTPTTGHVDTTPVGHVDTPPTGHIDSPAAGHVDAAMVAHADSPPMGHIDAPATGHVDTPIQHIDSPPSRTDGDGNGRR